jgi:hypothetical protein
MARRVQSGNSEPAPSCHRRYADAMLDAASCAISSARPSRPYAVAERISVGRRSPTEHHAALFQGGRVYPVIPRPPAWPPFSVNHQAGSRHQPVGAPMRPAAARFPYPWFPRPPQCEAWLPFSVQPIEPQRRIGAARPLVPHTPVRGVAAPFPMFACPSNPLLQRLPV